MEYGSTHAWAHRISDAAPPLTAEHMRQHVQLVPPGGRLG